MIKRLVGFDGRIAHVIKAKSIGVLSQNIAFKMLKIFAFKQDCLSSYLYQAKLLETIARDHFIMYLAAELVNRRFSSAMFKLSSLLEFQQIDNVTEILDDNTKPVEISVRIVPWVLRELDCEDFDVNTACENFLNAFATEVRGSPLRKILKQFWFRPIKSAGLSEYRLASEQKLRKLEDFDDDYYVAIGD